MISSANLAQALVTSLKANSALIANLGSDEEIREENWQGTDYNYPCVRFAVTRISPLPVSSNCPDMFDVDLNVSYRGLGPSSRATADGMSLVVGALRNQRLTSTVFTCVTPVKLVDVAGPLPEGEKAWMARAFFTIRVKEL
jgi:hypothetical protein